MTDKPALRLYHFPTSNSSWRVRWALALKSIPCELILVDLVTGAQRSPEHLARNPLGAVPVLERLGQSNPFLSESVAIINWLDRTYPEPPLFPADARLYERAHQLAQIVNADIHPLQNTSTVARHSADPAEQLAWKQYWTSKGLAAYETIVAPLAGLFSLGDAISYPDLFLVPIVRNALNNKISLDPYPTIAGIYQRARATEAAKASEPERFLTGAAPQKC